MAKLKPLCKEEVLRNYGDTSMLSLNNIVNLNLTEGELDTLQTSPYYSLANFADNHGLSEKTFNVLSLNVQSINAKFSSLQIFLDSLRHDGVKFHAICLQETWLNDNADTTSLHLNGYKCINKGKTCSSHGGLMIYVDDEFDSRIINISGESNIWENMFIEIKGLYLHKTIVIGNIYKPPKSNNNVHNIESFINELEPILAELNNRNAEILLTGDFNINLLKINEKDSFAKFLDTMLENSFFPKITLPTRISTHSCTLIDNIFVKLSPNSLNNTSGIFYSDISDHFPYFTCLNNVMKTSQTSKSKYIKLCTNSHEAYSEFLKELTTINLTSLIDQSPLANPNENYDVIHEQLSILKNKHMPYKYVKFNKYKHRKTGWITSGLIKSIKYRDKLYKELRTTEINSTAYYDQKRNLKTYNGILKKSIRDAKLLYYHSKFESYKNDIKKTWHTISEIISKRHRKHLDINEIVINGSAITNKTCIAEKFNDFFSNIGPRLLEKHKLPNDSLFKSYLKNRIPHSFSFNTITESETAKIIRSLPSKSSSGHDGISIRLLKFLAPGLIQPLTIIINQSLLTGIFPDKLKIAKVIPLHKKDQTNLLDNYRPISLLPSISKIFEKIAHKQLQHYLLYLDLLYDFQYGFRPKHSTDFACADLTDRILQQLDNRKNPIAIFMDLSKAFDTLDHKILLSKLQYYGVNGAELKFFHSYLNNRKQYVEVNEYCSNTNLINTGVPQGSILGPLLFLIYMNDIPSSSKAFDFILYADDTTLVSTVNLSATHERDFNRINLELEEVHKWLRRNKLTLNINKTKYMIFHCTTRFSRPSSPSIVLDDTPIEQVHTFHFLGLTISETLSWKPHTDALSLKIAKYCGIFNKMKNYLPSNILRTLYFSLINSILNYCILSWGLETTRLFKLQKKIIRIISKSKYNSHSEPLFKKLNILKLEDMYKLNVLNFYYKYCNNMLPTYFSSFGLATQGGIHHHNTRHGALIRSETTRTTLARRCLRHSLPGIINTAPPEITQKIQTHSLPGFSLYTKKILLNSYCFDCSVNDCYICRRNT